MLSPYRNAVVFANDKLFLVGTTNGDMGSANAGNSDAFVAQFDDSGSIKQIEQFGTNLDDEAA
jgi:hypothetical protein